MLFRTGMHGSLLTAAALLAIASPAHAQDASSGGKSPLYDAVSIKPNKSGAGMMRVSQGNDGYLGTNVGLKMLIQYAYKLQTLDQIAGLPG
jgi:hypothetical protein